MKTAGKTHCVSLEKGRDSLQLDRAARSALGPPVWALHVR